MDKTPRSRRDRLLKEKRHDTYKERRKWPEPTVCTKCNSLFQNGRWSWEKPPKRSSEAVCPACQRTADNYPAGYVIIKGSFFKQHRQELSSLIYNEEKLEKEKHPLERIMSIVDEDNSTLITTTGVHVARRIGEALSRAYQGDFSFQYGDGEKSIRVYWNR